MFQFIRLAVVPVFLRSNRNPKIEVDITDWDINVIGLAMFLHGGMRDTLGLWTRKKSGYFKQGLMGYTSRSMEDWC